MPVDPSDASAAPDLSVAVAGVNVGRTARRWFEALLPQLNGRKVEVLLALAERDASLAASIGPRAVAQVLIVPDDPVVPGLWAAAIAKARGRVVAVTMTPCLPAPDWIDAILAAHATSRAPGIGGTIDLAAEATLVDRAVHLVRYSSYLPPVASGPAVEIAADNASYARAHLEAARPIIEREGFWEAEFHRELRAHGHGLWLDPRIRVVHHDSYSLAGFSRQRFAHGRHFGRSRRDADRWLTRLARVSAAPLVPLVMLARIIRALIARHRLDGRMLMALPLATWFLACWATGEAVGQFDE